MLPRNKPEPQTPLRCTFILALIFLTSCNRPQTVNLESPLTLTIHAAASMTDAFIELGNLFTAANPNVTVVFNFSGSQDIVNQLNAGAPGDVFASASQKTMDAAIEGGRIAADTQKIYTRNQLVIVVPKGNPAGIHRAEDLAKPGYKLVLADKDVPVGAYSLTLLENLARKMSDAAIKDKVLANVVSYENNVRAVFNKVALGEVDAGIVYLTDAIGESSNKVEKIIIPDDINVISKYFIAPIGDSPYPDLARHFIELVLSEQGRAVLAKYGFQKP